MKRGLLFFIVMAIALASLAQDWDKIVVGPDKPNKTELQSLKGITGNVQGQLNGKFDINSGVLLSNDVFLKSFDTPLILTDAATITWDGSALTGSRKARVTLAGSRTLSITNPVAGQTYELIVTQDATGGRTLTLPSNVLWKNGVLGSLSTLAGAIDLVTLKYDGTNFLTEINKLYTGSTKDKILAHYSFDETSGTSIADAKAGLTATVYGGTLVNQTGIKGQCVKFDGTDDYALLPTNALLDATNVKGFNFWAKFSDPSANFAFIYQSSTNDNSILFSNDFNLLQVVRNGLTPNSQEVSFGATTYDAWHMFSFVYTGSALQIYIDASLKLSTASSGTLTSSTNQWNIGRYFWGAGYYNGYMDELTVFSTAPTATELATLYNSGVGLSYNNIGTPAITVTNAEINYLSGVTSAIQTQINAKAPLISPNFTTSASIGSVAIPTISSTNTLTNKRITKRAVTVTQSATPVINTDNTDVAHITGLAQAITSMTTNLTGTPVEGDELRIDFTDNGTARAIAWGTKFEASTVALPTTTVISARLDCFFVWNSVTSKWRLVKVS